MTFEPFDLYTPGAKRLYSFEFHGEQQLLTAEVRRTLEGLAAAAPARIAKGALTEEQATAVMFCWLTIAEDLEAQDKWLAEGAGHSTWSLADKLRELRAAAGVAWADKVTALRREIEARRTGYPPLVDKGQLAGDQAKQQLERLEAVHDLYWRHCYGFDGSRDELRKLGDVCQSTSVAQFGEAPVPSVWNERGRVDGGQQAAA